MDKAAQKMIVHNKGYFHGIVFCLFCVVIAVWITVVVVSSGAVFTSTIGANLKPMTHEQIQKAVRKCERLEMITKFEHFMDRPVSYWCESKEQGNG